MRKNNMITIILMLVILMTFTSAAYANDGTINLALDHDEVPSKQEAYNNALTDKLEAEREVEIAREIGDQKDLDRAIEHLKDMEIALREAEQELQDARCEAGEIGSIEESKLIEETGISADREETDRIKAKPVVIKTVTKTIKCRKLKKKDQFCRPITIKNAKGDVSFSAQKNNTKQLSISKSTGRIRIKHNTGKGKYKLKVKIRVKGKEGDADYVKNVTVHIIVK